MSHDTHPELPCDGPPQPHHPAAPNTPDPAERAPVPVLISGAGPVGWAAAGRLGAIISPLAAGFLLDRGATPAGLFVIFAVPAFLGAAAVFGLVVRGRDAVPEAESEVTAPEKSAANPDWPPPTDRSQPPTRPPQEPNTGTQHRNSA